MPGGVNFSIFSANATSCTLVLFEKEASLPFAEIPFPPEYRLGNVWAMTVFDLNYEQVEYGYRLRRTPRSATGAITSINRKSSSTPTRWKSVDEMFGSNLEEADIFPFRGRIPFHLFDWGHTRPLKRQESE